MKLNKLIILLFVGLVTLSFSWPNKLEQKVKATVTKTFKLQDFNLEAIHVDKLTEGATVKKINQCLFSIQSENKIVGYVYVGESPSMKNVFDYAILFSLQLEIINTKVLIYREKHGRQIGMKRWLKQFFGMQSGDLPYLDDQVDGIQVDGISGATISARSMTNSVRDVLTSMNYLKTKSLLPDGE